jgi:hypothetical protein
MSVDGSPTNDELREWRELADKLAIREQLERYMRWNDDRDADRIADVFDEDARFQMGGTVYVGRDAIRDIIRAQGPALPHWTESGGLFLEPATSHISSNPVIDVHGDTATAETDFLVIRRDDNGRAKLVLVGRFRDRWRRRADGWWVIAVRTGVSLARPGDEHTDAGWRHALEAMSDEERALFESW